ncbi:helix-turn-helix domain-containing protein [Micromonospora sp. NPDC049523]|uniref:winged helix-turn-helix transcriptional regulator n=1 Tax=Micromonospora sp. NPDC049523 TaxID=3155921 RepID=UPI003412D740
MTRGAAQRRVAAREAHLDAMAGCPGHRVLDRLGDKWVSLVLKELGPGPRRHADLARSVAGASQKMLTQTLRGLERDGLVTRTVTAGVPPRVDYRLTALGAGLLQAMLVVVDWAERHVPEIDAARARYDGKIVGPAAG